MHLYPMQISKIVAGLFIGVTLVFSVYAFGIFSDLRNLQQSKTSLFEESQVLDSHFRQFQRALGFGGIIHNIKEYLIHPDEKRLYILSVNVKELEHAYTQLRNHLHHNPHVKPSLQKLDQFVESFHEKLVFLKSVKDEEISAAELNARLGLESPEVLSAVVTLEALMDYDYQLSIQDIRDSIDEIVKDLVIVGSILPITLFSGLFLAWSLRETTHDKLRLEQAAEEQKRLHTELRQKHKMEAVGLMAGGIAHNFNNNLAVILGNLELAEMKLPAANQAACLERARISVYRSRDLVKKILSYSRQAEQEVTTVQFGAIIEETIWLLQSTLPSSTTLQKHMEADSVNVHVRADASQLQELLFNLCNNAVQAMQEQGTLEIAVKTVEISPRDIPAHYVCAPGIYVRLSVRDTGCGIPEHVREQIFDPFFTTKPIHEGAGMGLATVQGIVVQHGGFIAVESCEGEGTTFQVNLPIAEKISSVDPISHEIEKLPGGTEHILYVDDEEMLIELAEEMLTSVGYEVTSMSDSGESLKLFWKNAERIDLLITDQTMPGLTGLELMKEIKKIKPKIPVILCTGHSNMVNAENAQQQGVDAYLEKPLCQEQLLQTVRRVLDGNPA